MDVVVGRLALPVLADQWLKSCRRSTLYEEPLRFLGLFTPSSVPSGGASRPHTFEDTSCWVRDGNVGRS
ncbi:hypothetical protein E2C01_018837 [Portunus trituberculatus]|uniref:Uncharacterized protein n=1 Tax=Portunus trituberculatus TaxID=210409 RepID=A0A5B7DWQ2_PORTR|nr:hypothetical protein [Portunus trituberculatus]